MSEDLRARVREVSRIITLNLLQYHCRAATLDGKAIDFSFALDTRDERNAALQPGSRVIYTRDHGNGLVTVPGFGARLPADEVVTTTPQGPNPSYREALFFEPTPPVAVVSRVKREARRMGFEVVFGVENGKPFVEVSVPGRGNTKHYQDPGITWDEVLTDAGLGGTIS